MENLHQSLFFYRAAFERNPKQDRGYGGINAAYVLDILAARTRVAGRKSGMPAREAVDYENQADDLRKTIVDDLTAMIEEDSPGQSSYGRRSPWRKPVSASGSMARPADGWTGRETCSTRNGNGKRPFVNWYPSPACTASKCPLKGWIPQHGMRPGRH